ncbi:MAG: hypothetical protein ACE5GX_07525 [Thermoanaerobaculia bacterium]
MRDTRNRITACFTVPVLLGLFSLAGSPAHGQILLDSTDALAWDRPEAWAMKYFAAVSMMGGYAASAQHDPGAISIGFDAGWVPSLSEEERRVGFLGSKVEDLNRTSAFGRVRASVSLPARWTLTLGFVPPAEIGGVTPELYNLALVRPVISRSSWTLAARLHGQTGSLEGDLTCPADVVGSTDPAINPEGCLEPSNDEVTMDYIGLEWTYSRTAGERWRPYVSASANYLDLKFQVRARYSLFLDRTRLLADGWTATLAVGTRYRTAGRLALAGEIFYAPLDVVRDPARGSENDALLNARLLIEHRIR